MSEISWEGGGGGRGGGRVGGGGVGGGGAGRGGGGGLVGARDEGGVKKGSTLPLVNWSSSMSYFINTDSRRKPKTVAKRTLSVSLRS